MGPRRWMPCAELAILNQVEGPESRLAAGTLVKRVVPDGAAAP